MINNKKAALAAGSLLTGLVAGEASKSNYLSALVIGSIPSMLAVIKGSPKTIGIAFFSTVAGAALSVLKSKPKVRLEPQKPKYVPPNSMEVPEQIDWSELLKEAELL